MVWGVMTSFLEVVADVIIGGDGDDVIIGDGDDLIHGDGVDQIMMLLRSLKLLV